jgi:hypothetical protein
MYLWYIAEGGIYMVYTVWGIYRANNDIFHAIKVANEVWTEPLVKGPTAVQYCQDQSLSN